MKQESIIPLSLKESFFNPMYFLNENIHFSSSVTQIYSATFSFIRHNTEKKAQTCLL